MNDKKIRDLQDIALISLRYTLGQKGYVTYRTANFVKDNYKVIDQRVKTIMLNDLRKYFNTRNIEFHDDECDFETWLDLKEWLEKLEVTE